MKEITLSECQKELAKSLKISERFLKLLLHRGILEKDIFDFLHPSVKNMMSPLQIKGIAEARDRINFAIKNKQKVLIFGDYDCDGICAVSILMLYLRDKLSSISYFIPERALDGYGMTVDALKKAISASKPDLVITVDCGVTSVAEVDFLNQQEIDVIVTDHHEPQGELPNCIVVDPKVERNGFSEFCGAGVALKIVEALSSLDEASKYLDIAAIATIADIVPLTEDNRIIAAFGLKMIKTNPRKGLKLLLGVEQITSQDVMFKLAPKMNAAGRLNSAMKVVDVFLENDYFMLKSLSEELDRDNIKRQEICEQVVFEARKKLGRVNFNNTRIIVLVGENWEAGVLGIAAARLLEEFKCPAILFAKTGDNLYKGSARSIPTVNIFELLTKFKDYFVSFGGHSQAAGLSITADKFEEFAKNINEELLKTHDYHEFLPQIEYEAELEIDSDMETYARELTLIEPTGYGNPKPNFLIKTDNLQFANLGFTRHVKSVQKNLDIVGFGKFNYLASISRGKYELEVTIGLNEFQNKVTAQGIIKSLNIVDIEMTDEECTLLNLHQLSNCGKIELPKIDCNDIEKMLTKPFGTLFVCFTATEYQNLIVEIDKFKKSSSDIINELSSCKNNELQSDKIKEMSSDETNKFTSDKIKELPLYLSAQKYLCAVNAVVIAPNEAFDFSFYQNVVVAGSPLADGYLKHIAETAENLYGFGNTCERRLKISENTMRCVYAEMRNLANRNARAHTFKQLYELVYDKIKVSKVDFFATLKMLEDLLLISITDRGIINVSTKKTDLNLSAVYKNIVDLQNK
ncbi:MAG: single-stranded-DNA-specific exonuclease RecJ [Clostridia bacterium]